MTPATSSSHFSFELSPNSQQQAILDEMLEGPLLLQRLLSFEPAAPSTTDAASAFLDRNWKRLSPYMFRAGGRQSPKAIEELILKIARDYSEVFTLEFQSKCLFTPNQCAIFPIPGVGEIPVAEPNALTAALRGNRHTGGFGLAHFGGVYSVEVDLMPAHRPDAPAPQPRRPSPATNRAPAKATSSSPGRQSPQASKKGLAASDFLALFNNRVTAHLQQQLKISRQFTTTRFDDLSGWGVSGGLPSLGKRR